MTHGATLGGHAVRPRVERAGIDAAEVDDVIMGCATPEGATGSNIARQIALRAGLPITVSGVTVNRFCSSGLQTIAMAAQRIIAGEGDIVVAGGVESISCVQNEMNKHMLRDRGCSRTSRRSTGRCCRRPSRWPSATGSRASAWTSTAPPASSGRRARAGRRQVRGRDRADHRARRRGRRGDGPAHQGSDGRADEGIRAGTTYEGVKDIKPAIRAACIAAGNASQFSDGAGACVVMNEKLAEQRGLKPLGRFRGFAVAGCEPDEMGIGPVFAVPKVLKRARPHGRRHRPLGAERGVRGAGALLPRHARHPRRTGSTSTAARSPSAIPTA